MNHHIPRYLDGPKFANWLLSEGVQRKHLSESENRRFHAWLNGARADVYSNTCDAILTRNLLMHLIPDECWHINQHGRQGPPNRSTEIQKLVTTGFTPDEIATKLNLTLRTVKRYISKIEQTETSGLLCEPLVSSKQELSV